MIMSSQDSHKNMKRSTQESSPSAAVKIEGLGSKAPLKKTKRSELTPNACTRCRSKKSKCDGTRPICARCQKDGAGCVFDVGDGLTKMQGLQQQLDQRNEDHDRLMTLLDAFRDSTDDIATLLLARLRIGESIEHLVASLEDQDDVSMACQQDQLPELGGFPNTHHDLWPDLNPHDPDVKSEPSDTLSASPSSEHGFPDGS